MDLDEYLGRRTPIGILANKVGYSREHISGVMSGRARMGIKLAKALELATEGKLKADELLEDNKKKMQEKNIPKISSCL